MTYDNWKAHNPEDDGWEDWPPEEEAEMGMIDITKPVRTKSGDEVKELHIIAGKIVGNLYGILYVWDLDGSYPFSGQAIENVPEPRFVWLPVYDSNDYITNSLALAIEMWPSAAHILRVNLDTGEAVKEEV